MTILEIVAKITLCLAIAAALGFLIGWLFSNILRREKEDEKYRALLEEYEVKKHDILQLEEELSLKNATIEQLEIKYDNCERERLNAELDEKDCQKYHKVIEELRAENNMLISQIKEQKLCEDENEMLKADIEVLEEERDSLLNKIDECKEYQENYKNLILEVESLKSAKEKLENKQIETSKEADEEVQIEGTERIFNQYEVQPSVSYDLFEKIKENVLLLKEEVAEIKKERDHYKNELKKVQKKLEQKKKALKSCKEECKKEIHKKSKKNKNDLDHIYEMANKTDTLDENNIEIKSLTQLIKDTLDDLKK